MTRKEAIEYWEGLRKTFSSQLEKEENHFGRMHLQTTIDAIDMAISALRQRDVTDTNVGKWISVKDRLPEAGGYVVCIAKRNPFSRFMPMVARIEKNGWENPITEQYISEVTHWMPLPEPPEEPY